MLQRECLVYLQRGYASLLTIVWHAKIWLSNFLPERLHQVSGKNFLFLRIFGQHKRIQYYFQARQHTIEVAEESQEFADNACAKFGRKLRARGKFSHDAL